MLVCTLGFCSAPLKCVICLIYVAYVNFAMQDSLIFISSNIFDMLEHVLISG